MIPTPRAIGFDQRRHRPACRVRRRGLAAAERDRRRRPARHRLLRADDAGASGRLQHRDAARPCGAAPQGRALARQHRGDRYRAGLGAVRTWALRSAPCPACTLPTCEPGSLSSSRKRSCRARPCTPRARQSLLTCSLRCARSTRPAASTAPRSCWRFFATKQRYKTNSRPGSRLMDFDSTASEPDRERDRLAAYLDQRLADAPDITPVELRELIAVCGEARSQRSDKMAAVAIVDGYHRWFLPLRPIDASRAAQDEDRLLDRVAGGNYGGVLRPGRWSMKPTAKLQALQAKRSALSVPVRAAGA